MVTLIIDSVSSNLQPRKTSMLDTFHVVEQYISDIAYQLWNSAGRPDGLSEKFWAMACDITGDVERLLFI